jgi:hypothetical protein
MAHAVEDAVAQDAGIVDHAVDAAEILHGRLDHALGAGRIGFRQMQWTTAGYRGLRISGLAAPAPADDAQHDGVAPAERLSETQR